MRKPRFVCDSDVPITVVEKRRNIWKEGDGLLKSEPIIVKEELNDNGGA